MDWTGLGWTGLGWAGLSWAGLGWAGLGFEMSYTEPAKLYWVDSLVL